MFLTIGPRCNTVGCAKCTRHVALIGEADLSSDLSARNIGATEHFSGPIDAAPAKQFTRRAAPGRAEHAGQVHRMDTDLRCDITDVQARFSCPVHDRLVRALRQAWRAVDEARWG